MNDLEQQNLAFKAIESKNYQEAIRLLVPLSEKGSEYALLSLGWIYDQGLKEHSNRSLAQKYYEAAADNGSAEAYHHLGWLFFDNADRKSAKNAFESGAQQGDLGCMSMLGKMLVEAGETPANVENGVMWLKKAAAAGHVMAKRTLLSVDEQNARSVFERLAIKMKILLLTIRGAKEYLRDPYSEKVR